MSTDPALSRKRSREDNHDQSVEAGQTNWPERNVKVAADSSSIMLDDGGADVERGQTLNLIGCLPKLIVLDLDKTLWPFYCHEQTLGPYSRCGNCKDAVRCRTLQGAPKVVRLFPEVVDILRCIQEQGSIHLAVASRSPEEAAGRGLLQALDLLPLFCSLRIHRGNKVSHFQTIASMTRVPYRDMVFFDDDNSNIKAVSRLGVCCVLVSKETGLTFAAVRSGLKKYREANSSRASMRAWLQPTASRIGADDETSARPIES